MNGRLERVFNVTQDKSKTNISTQSRINTPKFDATREIRSLQNRVTSLERKLSELLDKGRNDLDSLEADLPPKQEKRRRGPNPVHKPTLLAQRDELIQMLEGYWPEIEVSCLPSPKPRELQKVLSSIRGQANGRHKMPAEHLLANMEALLKFLSSDRFRSDPRQIANAFAGFPAVSTWRSLKLCQSVPSQLPIGSRAIRIYVRRKHPKLFAILQLDISLPHFVNSLRDYGSRETMLLGYTAQYLYECWLTGKPDFSRLIAGKGEPVAISSALG